MQGIFVLVFIIGVFYVVRFKLNQSFLVSYASAFFGVGFLMFINTSNNKHSDKSYSHVSELPKAQQYQSDVNQAVASLSTPLAKETQYFHDVECTEDCSGHEAGYKYAEKNGFNSSASCTGKSDSFVEGCRIYAKEHPYNVLPSLLAEKDKPQPTPQAEIIGVKVEEQKYEGHKGVIEYAEPSCGSHYIASVAGEFLILTWFGGYVPFYGDHYVGFSSPTIGMQKVWNESLRRETTFWVESSSFSQNKIIEDFSKYCPVALK
jgi:hypothetical protein